MAESIQTTYAYNDFDRSSYFILCFNKLASSLFFETPLEENKENMEAALGTVDPHSQEFEVLFKTWNTEDAKNADFSKDFAYQYFLKGKSKKLLVWLSLDYESLKVDFFYDSADLDAEQWVIATNHQLRRKFGLNRTPVFRVLCKDSSSFYTEKVRTEEYKSDIRKMYNDDFIEINEIIEDSLLIDRAGLILLHGAPGTGKTSYIKNLICKHDKKNFIFIQNEFIKELLHPDFMSFLLNHQNSILIIEDAEKVLMSREQVNESSVVSTILQLTDGLFSDYLNIKIICTFNTGLDKIDKALLRKGRIIAYYEFKALTPDKANELLRAMDHESAGLDMTLADIFNYRKRNFIQAEKGKIGFGK